MGSYDVISISVGKKFLLAELGYGYEWVRNVNRLSGSIR